MQARLLGLLFLLTFVTSIPAVVFCYHDAIADPHFILSRGKHLGIEIGALLELVLIVANVATALVLHGALWDRFPGLSLSYVACRLVECGFIAVGLVALLALDTIRLEMPDADPAMLILAGRVLVAVHDWTFRIGPGVVVGVGNGLVLGSLMWQSRLVPRGLSLLGILAGPPLILAGIMVMAGLADAGGRLQIIFTIPEFLWELVLGLWLLARGFGPAQAGFNPQRTMAAVRR